MNEMEEIVVTPVPTGKQLFVVNTQIQTKPSSATT